MRRVNSEIDRQIGDALVGSSDAIRLILDLFSEEKMQVMFTKIKFSYFAFHKSASIVCFDVNEPSF